MTATAPGRLVGGEPESIAAQAARLAAGADILDALAARVGVTVAVGWSGVAAHSASDAAAQRAGGVRSIADRCRLAAESLSRYAAALAEAQSRERLVGSLWREAMDRERRTSADPGTPVDPEAGRLRDAAERLRVEAELDLDAAAYRAVVELSELAGRPAPRPQGSRLDTALDVVGLVPVVGDAVDVAHAGALYLHGDRGEAILTLSMAVPGPPGWTGTSAKLAWRVPHGYRSRREWREFRRAVHENLREAGANHADVFLGGSAVTGRSFKTGRRFRDGGPDPSDFDLAIVDRDLWEEAVRAGVPLRGGKTRTLALHGVHARLVGLDTATHWLTELAGRDVSFMLYRDHAALRQRGPWRRIRP